MTLEGHLDLTRHPILFSVPRFTTELSEWHFHIPTAMLLVDLLRPRRIVELGTATGDSYCAFCQAVDELGVEAACFAVDTWHGDPQTGFYGPEVLETLKAHHDSSFGHFSTLLQMTFDEASSHFESQSVDLLHIDGCHTYEAVSHDLQTWLPKVSPAGIVLFHDTAERERDFGVYQLWSEIEQAYPGRHVEFTYGHGLGVFAPNEVPDALRPIFNKDAESTETLERVLFALGHRVRLLAELSRSKSELIDAKDELRAAESQADLVRVETAQALHALRSVLDSRSFRAAAPLRGVVHILRRVIGRRAPRSINTEGEVESASFTPDGLRLTGWCWSASLRSPLLSLFVDGREVASWHPRRPRPDIRFDRGFRRDRLGFDVTLDANLVHGGSQLTLAVTSPSQTVLMETRVQLMRGRIPDDSNTASGSESSGRAPRPLRPWRRLLLRRRLHLEPSIYSAWLHKHLLAPERIDEMRVQASALEYQPKISIVMRTHDPESRWLTAAIESVRAQIYENWELCIVDDGSSSTDTRDVLRGAAQSEPRITVEMLSATKGLTASWNAALGMATGEFVGFLDQEDELRPNALLEVARMLDERRDLDFMFSDEDEADREGRLSDRPFFKPGWSPDLLMSQDYVTHFSVCRLSLIQQIGGFRDGFGVSQDFDLALRATERTDRIGHISWPVYTRRITVDVPGMSHSKRERWESGRRALEDALARRGFNGSVGRGQSNSYYRVRYCIDDEPTVTIIIPTRDRIELLRACIDSITHQSTYSKYDILIVDNNSAESEAVSYLAETPWRVLPYAGEFNFAGMLNSAVGQVDSRFVLFLNNDTEVISPDWIECLLEHGQRDGVAAVGGRLLYPDGRPQHEGIVVEGGPYNIAWDHTRPLYRDLGRTVRNCSAVTAACMLMRTQLFRELGGFDEELRIAYNDVDICLRALERGYVNVYTPYALLYHKEGASRGRRHPSSDTRAFSRRWVKDGQRLDPYYNPRLAVRPPFALSLD